MSILTRKPATQAPVRETTAPAREAVVNTPGSIGELYQKGGRPALEEAIKAAQIKFGRDGSESSPRDSHRRDPLKDWQQHLIGGGERQG